MYQLKSRLEDTALARTSLPARLQTLHFHSELFPATDMNCVAAMFPVSQQGGRDLSEVAREDGELKVASLTAPR